jgi:glycosyltransferase involved in cell wall biosynthesis
MPPSLQNGAGSDDAPRVYIDLTDVIVHGMWHPTMGGIVRVQMEVACALLRSDPSVVPFSIDSHCWRDLRPLIEGANFDSNAIFAKIYAHYFYQREHPRWHDPRHLLSLVRGHLAAFGERLRSRRPQFRAGDTLFVGGAFWMIREVLDLIAQAAAKGVHLVVLFHDLIPFTQPQFTGHDFTAEYGEVLCLPAHFVVTTPFTKGELETVRAEICKAGGPTTVSIIPLAEEFPGAKRNEKPSNMTERLKPIAARPFVLYVSTIEIRKNHLMLLSVWEELAEELGARLPILVIAGRRGWKAEEAQRKLDEARERPGGPIVFVEGPREDELRWLYASCLFTVFPSFFEGWGLPVSEGFWFGKTCAAANTSSVPTVGRDLCEYFSPSDPAEMKTAIVRLLDPELRRAHEAKIAATPMRTWADVGADIARLILDRAAR